MSFVKQIQMEEAPPDVQRIFASGQRRIGLIYNNWKIFAHAPHILRAFTQFIGAVLNPVHLEKRVMELCIVKTSMLNKCHY